MRAAIIGLGIGTVHAEVYDRRPEITAIALCDRDPAKLAEVAARLRKPVTCHASPEELFAAGRVDLASVVTPDPCHRAHCEAAFAAGADVLVTKPLATALEDARAIAAAAQAAGRRCMVAHERRFRPFYAAVHRLVSTGALGDLALLRLDMLQWAGGKFARAPWYADRASGRTAITGSGIHQVDLLRWLSGQEITAVRAMGNAVGELAFHGRKTVAALCALSGGTVGEIVFTYEATPPLGGERTLVVGSRGMIEGGVFRSRDGAEERLPGHDMTMEAGSAHCVDAFIDAIVASAPMPVGPDEAIRSLAAALAIDQAMDEVGCGVRPAA